MIKLDQQPVKRWQNLTSSAVLGLDRTGLANQDPDSTGEPLQNFLHEISVLSLYTQLGKTCAANGNLPYTAFDEEERTCNAKAALQLRDILEGEYQALLPEWCHVANQKQLKAPPECLPDLMDYACQHPHQDCRFIQEVIGKKGVWLASQNPSWKDIIYTKNLDEETWHTGTHPERLKYLSQLRAEDPQKARQLTEASWEQETPENRALFIEKFRIGLNIEDEPFLEKCLDDSRKPVRHMAAILLSCLPASGLCKRMTERLLHLVTYHSGKKGLLLSKKPTIEVVLPDISDQSLLRDGADPQKAGKLGQKAVAFANIIAAVPLQVWHQMDRDIEALLHTVLSCDFSESFSLGLSAATIRQQNPEWASFILRNYPVFIAKAPSAGTISVDLPGLINCLTPEKREAIIVAFAEKNSASKQGEVLNEFLLSCDHAWSEDFSQFAFQFLRQHYIKNLGNYQLRRPMIETFSLRLSPRIAEQVSAGWPTHSNRFTAGDEKMVDQLTTILQFRQTMIKELCRGA